MKLQITFILSIFFVIKCNCFFNKILDAASKVQESVQNIEIPKELENIPNDVANIAKEASDSIHAGADSVGDTIQEGWNGVSAAIDKGSAFLTENVHLEEVFKDVSHAVNTGIESLSKINAEDAVKTLASTIKEEIDALSQNLKFLEEISDSVFAENCNFKCENKEEKPHPNPNYRPKINGCGSRDLVIPDFALPNPTMNFCCKEHDKCFGTCGSSKGKCGRQFILCLFTACGFDISPLCHGSATLLYSASRIMECEHFKETQSQACICK